MREHKTMKNGIPYRKIMMSQIHLPILINNYLSIKNLLKQDKINICKCYTNNAEILSIKV